MSGDRGLFGYGYFDDPSGCGYRGYGRAGNGEGYLPWAAARAFCLAWGIRTAIDLGCAKGFLVEELLSAGVDAVGYDVSDYALTFARGLPCYRHDVRDGVPGQADAVFALGILLYVGEDELPEVLGAIRRATGRFLLVSGFYEGDEQEVPDPLRRITRSHEWWRAQIEDAQFRFSERREAFDVYESATHIS